MVIIYNYSQMRRAGSVTALRGNMWQGMVQWAMAKRMALAQHICTRAVSNCGGSRHMGRRLEEQEHLLLHR